MKTTRILITALVLLTLLLPGSPAALAQSATAAYIESLKSQIDQYKIDIERVRLAQADLRVRRQEAAANYKEAEIRKYQNVITLKQQEMAMHQQQDTMSKQPLSSNPGIAAIQGYIWQLTFEKDQIALQQTAATQAGNVRGAAALGQSVGSKQLQIQAKQQEIKVLELQQKSGR